MRMGSQYASWQTVTDADFAKLPPGSCALSVRPAGQADPAVAGAIVGVAAAGLLLGLGTLLVAGGVGYLIGSR